MSDEASVVVSDSDDCEVCKRHREAEAAEPLLEFFSYQHLPEHLAVVSAPFCKLATDIVHKMPRHPERDVALRKLLEGKDAAVRVAVLVAAGKV